MKTFRGVCFAAQVVLVLGSAGVFAQVEGRWKVDVRFEESDIVRRVEQEAIRLKEKPSFVGEVYFKFPSVSSTDGANLHFVVSGIPTTQGANQTVRRIPKGSDFLAAAIGGPVSVESKLYLMNLRNIGEDFSLRSEPNDVGVWSVYGRSREEVEAVARTALEQLNKKAYEKLERAKRDLERSKERVSSLEKEVAALLEEREVPGDLSRGPSCVPQWRSSRRGRWPGRRRRRDLLRGGGITFRGKVSLPSCLICFQTCRRCLIGM